MPGRTAGARDLIRPDSRSLVAMARWGIFGLLLCVGVFSQHGLPTKSRWLSVAADGSFVAGMESPSIPYWQPRVRVYEADLQGSNTVPVGRVSLDEASVSISRDGNRLAILSQLGPDSIVQEFGIDDAERRSHRFVGMELTAIVYVENDNAIACMQQDGGMSIIRFDPTSSRYQTPIRQARKVLFDSERRVSWIDQRGRLCVSGGDLRSSYAQFPVLEYWSGSLAWDATPEHVATIGHRQRLRIRSMHEHPDSDVPFTLSGELNYGEIDYDTGPIAFNADGTFVGFLNGTRAHVVDAKSGNAVASLKLPAGHVGRQVAFQDQGHLLISTSLGYARNDRVIRWDWGDSSVVMIELGAFSERSKGVASVVCPLLLMVWFVWFVHSGIRGSPNTWRPFIDFALFLSTVAILLTAGIVSMHQTSLPFEMYWKRDLFGWASLATKLAAVASVAVWFVISSRRLGVRLVVVSFVASACTAMTLAWTDGRYTMPIYLIGPFTLQALVAWTARKFGMRIEAKGDLIDESLRRQIHVRDLLLLTIGASLSLLAFRSQSLPIFDFTFVLIPVILAASTVSVVTLTVCFGLGTRWHWAARTVLLALVVAATIAATETVMRAKFFSLQRNAVTGTLSFAFLLALVAVAVLRSYGYRIRRGPAKPQAIPT